VEVQLHAFLTSALYGGEWSATCQGCFTPGGVTPGTHWIRYQQVDFRACLNVVVKRKIPCPCWEWSVGHPAHSLVTILTDRCCGSLLVIKVIGCYMLHYPV